MAFTVDVINESPVSADGAPPALPHEDIIAGDRAPVTNENVTMGRHVGARALKESTKKLLETQATAVAQPEPAALAPAPTTPAEPAPAETPATTTTPTSQAIADDVAARNARLSEMNSRLVAEVESLRKAPPPKGDDTLDKLDNLFTTNPLQGFRSYMARVLGVPEDSKEIDRHEQFLEAELTSKRIGVPLTEDSDAARKAARTLVAIQREMRARKADETTKQPEPSGKQEGSREISIIADHIAGTKDFSDKYPLLMALTEDWNGVKPERLLWMAIEHGYKTGELDPAPEKDVANIDQIARQLETRYQARVAKIPPAARPSPAQPPAPVEEKKPEPAGKTVPTLTNATASVAPATPPPQVAKSDKATYRNRMEKRIAIIRAHTR